MSLFFRDSARKQSSLPFGAKKETAADIIAKSKREREERAKKKKEEESSIKIQAACRSYVVRKRQQALWQQQYASESPTDSVARVRLFLALSRATRVTQLPECTTQLLQHWHSYQSALVHAPDTRLHQARHMSKVILDALLSRDTNHVLDVSQLIALVDRWVLQEQDRVARWLIDRAELFRTIHELCDRHNNHVTALIDLAVHSYMASDSNDVTASAQLWWHLLSSEHVTDAHVTHFMTAVTRALTTITRDKSRVDFMELFRIHNLDLDTRGLMNAAHNGARVLRALVDNTDHVSNDPSSRDQLAHWVAIIEQCAALAQHRTAPRTTRVQSGEDEDAMEIEFTEPTVPSRDLLAEQTVAHICSALLSERARDQRTVLSVVASAVSTTLDWHSATLTRLLALLLPHCTAHDTRRVCEESATAYTTQWPALRQSEEFRRLLRDLTGLAVEHNSTVSTSASTDVLLHTWLTLLVTHSQLARIDRSGLHVDIPPSLQTVTRELCSSFQDKLVRLYWREDSAESGAMVLLRHGVTQLLSLAHELSAWQAGVWSQSSATMSAEQASTLLEAYPISFKRVMQHAPFLLRTKDKVLLLQQWIRADKEVHQPMEQGQIAHIQIRRTHLLQDVFHKLNGSLKRTIKIEFINQAGLLEAGIDGGGLFRELVNEVIKTAFSPQYGLFKATEQQQLYPNPVSALLVENDTDKFRFLGRLLGKCIYELCLVDLPFTEFFLAQLLDRPVAVHQLRSLDAALYKGLTSLRSYQGDFDDLDLTFSVHEDVSDIETAAVNLSPAQSTGRVVELIDQGSNIKVTRDNVEEYIALVAKYRMQTQISAQSRAFKEGLCEVIDREWLTLLGWTESEFALLINGEHQVHGLDIAAMQEHVVYAGGYHAHHPVVLMFWEVLSEFTPEQQSMLLKYATSSPRPPLLGFGTLQPKFCIKLSSQDESYLPSANTCMNLLKLPAYHSKQLMRDKLLYAINSNSGFDLS